MTYKIILQNNVPTVIRQAVNLRQIEVFVHYNYPMDNWVIDFYEITNNGKIPLVCGLALEAPLNILQGREYLGIGEMYLIPKKKVNNIYEEPMADNIHTSFDLLWSF